MGAHVLRILTLKHSLVRENVNLDEEVLAIGFSGWIVSYDRCKVFSVGWRSDFHLR